MYVFAPGKFGIHEGRRIALILLGLSYVLAMFIKIEIVRMRSIRLCCVSTILFSAMGSASALHHQGV